jgi:hypothetical protein
MTLVVSHSPVAAPSRGDERPPDAVALPSSAKQRGEPSSEPRGEMLGLADNEVELVASDDRRDRPVHDGAGGGHRCLVGWPYKRGTVER